MISAALRSRALGFVERAGAVPVVRHREAVVQHDEMVRVGWRIQLAVSRDSIHFMRVGDRSPFIPVGPVGSWDRFNNSIANNPPIIIGDELRFYYGGRMYRHSPYRGADRGWGRESKRGAGIGLATITG